MNKAKISFRAKTDTRIDSKLYGIFLEHLGRTIYDGIYVGEDSDIPNIRGIRADVVKALREISTPIIRWPGGCFASIYHWKDGIGPKEDRPRYENANLWHTVEDNSFGTHEFMDFCNLLGAEPYIAMNVETAPVQEMVDWIQYITHPYDTPMTRLRKKNGREEPWHLKYVGIGNECWGGGGNMRPSYYVDVARHYATFAINYSDDCDLFKVFVGPHKDNYEWTKYIMSESYPYQPDGHWGKNLMHGLSLHAYIYAGDYFESSPDIDFNEQQYANVINGAFNYDTMLTKHDEIMTEFDPEKNVKIVFDEWGTWYSSGHKNLWPKAPFPNTWDLFQQATQRDAIVTSVSFDIFNRHADRLGICTLAQAINTLQPIILTEPESERMVLTPCYHVFKMYMPHRDGMLYNLDIETSNYNMNDVQVPTVSASASEKDGNVFLTVTNTHFSEETDVEIALSDNCGSVISSQILETKNANDYNSFDNPETVTPSMFNRYILNGNTLTMKLPPHSIVSLLFSNNE